MVETPGAVFAGDEIASRVDFLSIGTTDRTSSADIAARATRKKAFTAPGIHSNHGWSENGLGLDVDETHCSTGQTDNEISRGIFLLLREFHEDGVPIVICTSQMPENVMGFLI